MSKSSFSLLLTSIVLKGYLAISGFVVLILPKKVKIILPKKSSLNTAQKPEIMAKRVTQLKKSSLNNLVVAHK